MFNSNTPIQKNPNLRHVFDFNNILLRLQTSILNYYHKSRLKLNKASFFNQSCHPLLALESLKI